MSPAVIRFVHAIHKRVQKVPRPKSGIRFGSPGPVFMIQGPLYRACVTLKYMLE